MRALAVALVLFAVPAHAATLTVLSGGATLDVEQTLAKDFTKANGTMFTFATGTAGQVQQKVFAGDTSDVVAASVAVIQALEKAGSLRAGSTKVLGRVGIGVASKAGEAKPDISTPEKFKAALLAAKSIVSTDPASGASSGIAFARILDDLGLTETLRPKLTLYPGGLTAEYVASGRAELAVQNISEILPVKGVVLAGPLPAALQTYTSYAIGVNAKAANPKLAQDFVEFLTKAANAKHWTDSGFETP